MGRGRRSNGNKARGRPVRLPTLDLHPRTRNWIGGVAVIVFGLIVFLSLIGSAGPVGQLVGKWLRVALGFGAWLVPPLVLWVAVLTFRTSRRMAGASIVGGTLTLVSLLAIFSVLGGDTAHRGGLVGSIAAFPVTRALGDVAAMFVFVAMGAIGIFVLLNYPADRQLRQSGVQRGEAVTRKTGRAALPQQPSLGARAVKAISSSPFFRIRPLAIRDATPSSAEASAKPQRERDVAFSVTKTDSDFIPRSDASAVPYTPPPLDLLERDQGTPRAGDIRANMAIIKRTLANFGIAVEMGEVTVGPTVTQYTLKPAEGVKLSQISSLGNDLALALAAHPIRIEAPIPGRSLVGIEVPNQTVALVRLRDLFSDSGFRDSPYRLTFALGRDVAGTPVFAALEKMPHLLIAGATGTGKTIALNTIITALVYRNPPSLLRLLLIDPKRVEFPVFNSIPHLLTPVVIDIEKTIHALRWAVHEMERRFDALSASRARDIGIYNRNLKRGEAPMPYLVIMIDELADIMAARGRDAEAAIVRLAQMARAVGIHLVVATQRPSVEVITGLIKANITSRVAFQVASQVDSRTILDGAGAEKLLGNGDMLFVSAETSKPRRIQGAYISEKEVKRIADFLQEEGPAEYKEGVTEPLEGEEGDWLEEAGGMLGDDPLYEEAKRLVIQMRKASASYLQRRLRVGYARAARLIDLLEERGIVGPGEGAKPREVLVGTGSNEEQDGGEGDTDW